MLDIPFFDCTPPHGLGQKLATIASEVISSGKYVGGDYVSAFENDLAQFLGGGQVVSVGNGLDALTISLMALGVGPGDEVIVPSYSFIATWTAVARVGAKCVVADVESTSGLVSLGEVVSKVSSRTKAFIPVHLYGSQVNLSEISEYLHERGVSVLEDCAQSIGATFGGIASGTIGTIAAFSFYPTKNLGGLGDGGAIFTRDILLAEKARSIRSYGFAESRYSFSLLGLNSRLDAIQAAFLSEKLRTVGQETIIRRSQALLYVEAANEAGCTVVSQAPTESVFHHFPIVASDRESFRAQFSKVGIATDMHYPYTFASFAKLVTSDLYSFETSDLEGASRLASRIVTLPIGSWLSDYQVNRVASALARSPA